MAARLPSAQQVRILLSAQTFDAEQFRRHARAFLEAGRPHEALAFLEKAPDEELLRRLKDRAIGEGDAFLLRWVERIGKVPVAAEEWAKLAAEARTRGKEAFAREADGQAT